MDADTRALSVVSDVEALIARRTSAATAILSAERTEIVGVGQTEIVGGAALKGICASVAQLFAAWDKTCPRGRDANFFRLRACDAFAFVSARPDARKTKRDVVLDANVLCCIASEPRRALSSDTASTRQVDANTLKVCRISACAEIAAFDAKAIIGCIAESTEADGTSVGASSRSITSAARGIIDGGRFADPVGHVARVKGGTNEFGGATFFSTAARFADLVLCALKPFARDRWIATPVGTEETIGARPPRTARIAFFDTSELFLVGFVALFTGATARSGGIARQ